MVYLCAMYTREFYLNTIGQTKSEPSRLMAREIYAALSDGTYPFSDLVADASAYAPARTVKAWIYGAAKHGLITITGEYVHRRGEGPSDTRMVGLSDWPVPDHVKTSLNI